MCPLFYKQWIDMIKYSFIKPKDCKSGKLKDSYVLAQNGKVVLKQVSKDGSIGPVCVK